MSERAFEEDACLALEVGLKEVAVGSVCQERSIEEDASLALEVGLKEVAVGAVCQNELSKRIRAWHWRWV